MSDYQPKAFRCSGCGMILGESYREDGSRVTQLRVYRYPRDVASGLDMRDVPSVYKFSATKISDGAIPCFCGHVEGWYANQTSIAEMLERRSSREMEHGRAQTT